jgi:hypothetical protein
MPVRNRILTILDGETQSDSINLGADILVTSIFVPDTVVGNTLTFYGDPGTGVQEELNFSLDLTSTTPYYRGQVVTGLANSFSGITSLSVASDMAQTQDVEINVGFTY